MLEIGGGKGNLSYVMCLLENKKAVSVDMESEFQALGKQRNERHLKEKADSIEFVTHFLDEDSAMV